jgi:hypothetical protein
MMDLVRLYPVAWRARYEAEFRLLLEERPPNVVDRLDIIRGAVDARIHPQVTPGRLEPENRTAGSRRAGALAALGGLFWAIASLGFYGAPYVGDLGYKDSGAVVLLGVTAAVLTGSAAVMVTHRVGDRSVLLWASAAAIPLGGIGLALPWPVLLLGFFSIVLGTLVFGLFGASRIAPAYILVGVGALLALGFNTEDDRALLLVPLGIAWMIVGALTIRGAPSQGTSHLSAGPVESDL